MVSIRVLYSLFGFTGFLNGPCSRKVYTLGPRGIRHELSGLTICRLRGLGFSVQGLGYTYEQTHDGDIKTQYLDGLLIQREKNQC